jgi:DNA-binding PadR family transcriptional regulator
MKNNTERAVTKHLPLTESTAYTLIALAKPLHGYGIMQKVEMLSQGTVPLGAGTLYGALSALEAAGLIAVVGVEDRRKTYKLTALGIRVIHEHLRRLQILVGAGTAARLWSHGGEAS